MGKQQSFEDHYDLIKHLYIVEDKTLLEVMDVMKQRGFDKSKRAYERWFSKWEFRKNTNWRAIGPTMEKRRTAGKQSVIKVNSFKKRDEEWVRKENSRRFVSSLDRIKINQSLGGEVSSSAAVTTNTRMVIRSPSPVFATVLQRYDTIFSPWHQLQDLPQMVGIPVMPQIKSWPGSTRIITDWHRPDNRHLFNLFPKSKAISSCSTRQLIQWTETEIRDTVPERHQNEHRQLAELLCTERGPHTIQYHMLLLFRLANNFIPVQSEEDDVIVVAQVKAMEAKWPGKLQSLLQLDNPVIRAAKEKIFASALRLGEQAILQALLDMGFNPNCLVVDSRDWWRERPAIYVAAGLKDEGAALRIVQQLINSKHRLETDAQSSALHRAVSMGRSAIADIFLQAQVPLHMPSLIRVMHSIRPYHSGPGVQTWSLIKSLVASGASNTADLLSALQLAIRFREFKIVSGLLDAIVCRAGVADEHHLDGSGVNGLTSAEVAQAFHAIGADDSFVPALEDLLADDDFLRQTLDAHPYLLSCLTTPGQQKLFGSVVWQGNFELTNLLLTSGRIDVNRLDQKLILDSWPNELKILTTSLGLVVWQSRKGDPSMVQLLIRNGATPADAFPLLAACYRGYTEIAVALLESGFEAKEADAYANALRVPDQAFAAQGQLQQLTNYTSCIGAFAAHFNNEDCIHQELLENLIQQGARIDEGFLVAISYRNLALIKLLLPHIESTPITWDDFGKTPLDVAVETGPLTVIEMLVGAGFTELRNVELIYGIDAVMFFEERRYPLLSAILESANGASAVSHAIKCQDRGLVEHLLRYDVDLNQHIRSSLSTPLESAVRLGDVDLVSRLLSRGALITPPVWTSLSDSSQLLNDSEVLKILLSFLDQDKLHEKPEVDYSGQPLLKAVQTRNHKFVTSFLQAGCWNAKYLGKSLTAAVLHNDGCLVQLLLDSGASLE